jgi:hypothetical protein
MIASTPLDEAQSKALAKRWRKFDSPYMFGQFQHVPKTEIMQASVDSTLLLSDNAAAIVTRSSRDRDVKDFTERTAVTMRADATVVKRFFGSSATACADLLKQCSPSFLFCWQESPMQKQVAALLDMQHVCTKIKSTSEVVGVYASSDVTCDAMPAHEAASLCRFSIDTVSEDLIEKIASKVRALDAWQSHYSNYNIKGAWGGLSLRGYRDDATSIEKPIEMNKQWKVDHPDWASWQLRDTSLMGEFAEVKSIIDSVPGVKHRIRLLRLEKNKGLLERHTDQVDPDHGAAYGKLMRVHVPIVTNDRVIFDMINARGEKLKARMRAGEFWYIDPRKPHRACNGGAEARVHLVMDVEATDDLHALLTEDSAAKNFLRGLKR